MDAVFQQLRIATFDGDLVAEEVFKDCPPKVVKQWYSEESWHFYQMQGLSHDEGEDRRQIHILNIINEVLREFGL